MIALPLRLGAVLALALLPTLVAARTTASADAPGELPAAPSWRLVLSQIRDAELVAAHPCGDLLLVADADHGVTALDPASGRLVWFVQLQGPLEPVPVAAGELVVLSTPDELVVVRLATGLRVGRLPQQVPPSASPVSDGDAVYTTSARGDAVQAYSLDTGLRAWSFVMPRMVTTLARLDHDGGETLLVGDAEGTLRAIPGRLATPDHEAWRVETGVPAGPPSQHARWILAASRDHVLVCLDAGSGRARWRHVSSHDLVGSPVVVGDDVVVGREGGAFAVSLRSGALLWDVDGVGAPLGALRDGRVLVDGDPGHAVLDAGTGALVGRVGDDTLAVGGELVAWNGRAVQGF